LILNGQYRHWYGNAGILLAAAALHNEDILITD
jgi:hypothetical protein